MHLFVQFGLIRSLELTWGTLEGSPFRCFKMAKFRKTDDSVYDYLPSTELWPKATAEMKSDFERNGYVIVRKAFSESEVSKVNDALNNWKQFWDHTFPITDTSKATFDQASWTIPGNDIFGRVAGCAKTVGVCEELLNEGELYMYSGKVIMKPANMGGALHWHQDYGYWYNNRCIWPNFITCIFALTKSDRENGGVQVIKGSHNCGRLEHFKQAGQTCADLERVALIETKLPRVHADLAAGDCIMFHANTLHMSEQNTSVFKRWNLIFSYNTKENSPDKAHYNAQYMPLKRFPADGVKTCESLEIEERPDWVDPLANPNVTIVPEG